MSVSNPYSAWVNQPSVAQIHHDLHGKHGLCVDDFKGSQYIVFYYARGDKLHARSMLRNCVTKTGDNFLDDA